MVFEKVNNRLILIGVLLICLIGTTLIFVALSIFSTKIEPTSETIIFTISHGMTLNQISDRLQKENLIKSSFAFKLIARLNGASRQLKAGTYQISGSLSMSEILNRLRSGVVVQKNFTIPEGFTIAEIAKLWESEDFGTAIDFLKTADQLSWRMNYGIDGDTIEGYLFPDTYTLADGVQSDVLISAMLDRFQKIWTLLIETETDQKDLRMTKRDLITLASIIESEAAIDDERPIISAVFHNRLRRGWKLEADPTVLYGLGDPDRPLTRNDLKRKTPYNTYLHKGLPPSPICNPGEASIRAALDPASVPYLFFVAIGDGRHHFSRTLSEHRRAIRKYRK